MCRRSAHRYFVVTVAVIAVYLACSVHRLGIVVGPAIAAAHCWNYAPPAPVIVSGTVTRVIDPFTVRLQTGSDSTDLRLAGLTVPNSIALEGRDRLVWGRQANERLIDLVLSNQITATIVRLYPTRSSFAVIELGSTNVNAVLIHSGLAAIHPDSLQTLPFRCQADLIRADWEWRHGNDIASAFVWEMAWRPKMIPWTIAVAVGCLMICAWWHSFNSKPLQSWAGWGQGSPSLRERESAMNRSIARRIIVSQEHERKRIAHELHDSLGQNLLLIRNRALLGLNSSSDLLEHLRQISTLALKAIEQIREISCALRPVELDRLGFACAVEELIKQASEASDVAFDLRIGSIDGLLSPEYEIGLYRVIQEGINNVLKHSHASEAFIEIERSASDVLLTIRDNGQGFDVRAWAERADGAPNMGLAGALERIRCMEGNFRILSSPGLGTALSVQIPAGYKPCVRFAALENRE